MVVYVVHVKHFDQVYIQQGQGNQCQSLVFYVDKFSYINDKSGNNSD